LVLCLIIDTTTTSSFIVLLGKALASKLPPTHAAQAYNWIFLSERKRSLCKFMGCIDHGSSGLQHTNVRATWKSQLSMDPGHINGLVHLMNTAAMNASPLCLTEGFCAVKE
jgi:hypothetical protein